MAKSWKVSLCIFLWLVFAGIVGAETQKLWFTNFTAGELSPKLDARIDFERFSSGAATIKNLNIYPQGGVSKRPGFKYIANVKSNTKESRLIPFVFSDDDAFILEFGDEYIRFYKDGGKIMSSVTPSEQYELTSPYDNTDLSLIKYAQSADVMYLVHPDYAPRKLIRSSDSSWTIQEVNFNPAPSVEDIYYPTSGCTISATSGTTVVLLADANTFLDGDIQRQVISGVGRGVIKTITNAKQVTIDVLDTFSSTGPFSAGEWYLSGSPYQSVSTDEDGPVGGFIDVHADGDTFRSADVGKYIRIHDGYLKITSYIGPQRVWGEILKELTAKTGTYAWTLESDVWDSTNGYPRAVDFFENRLVFAGSPGYPQTLWFSVSGDYEDFTPGADDDDSMTAVLSSSEINAIRWIKNIKKLLIGTTGGEWWFSGGGTWEPATPSSKIARRETTYGSNFIDPVIVENGCVFVQKQGKTVREYGYEFDDDAYRGRNLSLLAEHLTSNYGIIAIAYQQNPNQILYCLRSDGVILAATYMPDQKIIGWSTIETDGQFKSITTIPGLDRDELWVIVERVLDGQVVKFVEQLQTEDWDYSFTRTTSTLGDYTKHPACVLLLESNTTDGDTNIEDSSGYGERTVTMKSGAHHDTDYHKFGTTSIVFADAEGEYIDFSHDSDFLLGSSDFTIDYWVYSCQGIVMSWYSTKKTWRIYGGPTGEGYSTFYWSTDGNNWAGDRTITFTDNEDWHHVAFTRSGTTLYGFENGKKAGEWTIGDAYFYDTTNNFFIATDQSAGAAYDGGVYDEIRIVKGVAIWTADSGTTGDPVFQPPVIAYTEATASVHSTETVESNVDGFYVDSGLSYEDAVTIENLTTGPVIITATAHGFSSGDTVFIDHVRGTYELNGNSYGIMDVSANAFTLSGTTGVVYTPWISGGTCYKYTDVVSGATHLAGVTVVILADGVVQPDDMVSSGGTIAIDTYAYKIHLGLPYSSILRTIDVPQGTGITKKVSEVTARFFRTSDAQYGKDEDNLYSIDFGYASGTTPFTGDIDLAFDKGWNKNQKIVFYSDEPLPFGISGLLITFD